MDMYNLLPEELKWNVFKFMEHPVANLSKKDTYYQSYVDVSRSMNNLIEMGIIDEGVTYYWIWSRRPVTDSEDSLRTLAR